jgi:hypothetical protein
MTNTKKNTEVTNRPLVEEEVSINFNTETDPEADIHLIIRRMQLQNDVLMKIKENLDSPNEMTNKGRKSAFKKT